MSTSGSSLKAVLPSMRKLAPLSIVLVLGCDAPRALDPRVAPVEQAGELVVLTRLSPTTRYVNPTGQYSGMENDLAVMFAKELNVPVRFKDHVPLAGILPKLRHQVAHLAAAGIAASPETRTDFVISSEYQRTQQVVAFNSDGARPKSILDLTTKSVAVLKGSRAASLLRELRRLFPGLRWTEIESGEVHDVLAKLADGHVDVVVTDGHAVDVARNFFPNVQRAFALGAPEPLVWVFPKNVEPALVERANQFFARLKRDGTLNRLTDQYYGHLHRMETLDIENLIEKIQTVLPKFRAHFQRAEEITGIDWRLLAAIGFQESHWDPLATSSTGVRGLMMLTEDTADYLGVDDRLDAKQSILAGARFFLDLKERISDKVQEPDRTYMALAAYNIGLGHLEDARIQARRLHLNPNLWVDVKKALPMLALPEHYVNLKYGFARGGEAVILTENIRNYYDVLGRFQPPHEPGLQLPASLRSPSSWRRNLPGAWYGVAELPEPKS
ncbi:MAG: membrane-bound lytic murein transglycosylase MltF [Betaproteobacteria bacterium]|nr:membrane-bound lytic murein transglycosylase MltF [Betaproteobacteria bacterium]